MDIDTKIARLAGMSTRERHRFLESDPLPVNVGALLDEAVDEAGDRHAWDFFEGDGPLTYRALRDRVNVTANALRAWGVLSTPSL